MRALPCRSLLVLTAFFALLASRCATAQTSAAKPAQGPPPVVLTANASKVLDTLDTLQQLPLGDWRYHAGDIAHAEEMQLDDSSWQVVKPPFSAGNDAVWFRQTVEVPRTLHGYDLTGATVMFHFNIYANGPMPLIIYFNGRRVALGEDLEPIVLFDHLKPGDKAVIAVKVLHTVDKKDFEGADATVQFAGDRPNPLLFAMEARCAQVLIPSVAAENASASADLNKAIEAVSLAALGSAEQKKFDESLMAAQAKLDAMRPLLQQTIIRMAGNAHIDAAWLWPESETIDVARRTFATALQLEQEYPNTYTQSAAQYSEWIEQKYPDEFKLIQQAVKDHRWEMVGGMWVEPDLNLPAGESLVRQLLVGKTYFQQKFGVDVTVGWNPDSFGYNFQLPQIYKKSGVDYFVTQKMWWNDTNPLPLKLFWWQGLDGSRVLTYFPHDYVNGIDPLKIAKDFAAARTLNPGTTEMLHLYGIGDHGGGPTRAMLDEGQQWMAASAKPEDPQAPVLSYSYAETFFHDVEKKLDTQHSPVWNYAVLGRMTKPAETYLPAPPAGKVALPIWNDELYLEYHRGVYTTQAKHKQNMRQSEDWLTNAEKWSSLSWLGGAEYPATKLNEAWKLELFNQFHDLAAGSGIAVIYKDAQKDYDVVHATTTEATHTATAGVEALVNTQAPERGAVPVLVWNPVANSRTGLVHTSVEMPAASTGIALVDADGKVQPSFYGHAKTGSAIHVSFVAKDVPALGYKTFYAVPSGPRKETAPVTGGDVAYAMENEFLSVTVDPHTGCITHLVDKKTGFDAIAAGGCGNQLQSFVDTPKDYDAWNIDPGTLDHFTPIESLDSIAWLPDDGFTTGVTVRRHFGKSRIVQTIALLHGVPYAIISNDVDWHETHVLLKAAFPLAATSDHATYEIPYGAIERPTTRNNSFEKARFEVPALRWADLGDGKHGFSLINNSKYGYDCAGNVLRLTLLRSPTWPDPDADRGPQHFEYALYPHAGRWQDADTVHMAYEFNNPLVAQQVAPHAGSLPSEKSFASVDTPNVVLSAMKVSEDGKALIVRLYEDAGKATATKVTLPMQRGTAHEASMMEVADAAKAVALKDGVVELQFAPWEIKTLRIDVDARGGESWGGK